MEKFRDDGPFVYNFESLTNDEFRCSSVDVEQIELGQAFLLQIRVDYITLLAANQAPNGELLFSMTRVNPSTGMRYPYTNTTCRIQQERIASREMLAFSPVMLSSFKDDYRQKFYVGDMWRIHDDMTIEEQKRVHRLRIAPSTDVKLQHLNHGRVRDVFPDPQYL